MTDPATSKRAPRPCERCGTFGKRRNVLGQRLCEDCVERTIPSVVREASLGGVARGAALAMLASGSVTLVAIGVATVASVPDAVAEAHDAPLVSLALLIAADLVAYPLLHPLVAHAAWAWSRGEKARLGEACGRAVRSHRRLVWPSLWVAVTVGASAMLFIVPGLVRLAMTGFVLPIVLFEQRPTASAVTESIERTIGQRWTILACYAPSIGLTVAESVAARTPSLPSALAWSVAYAVAGTFEAAAVTILYASDRVRRKA